MTDNFAYEVTGPGSDLFGVIDLNTGVFTSVGSMGLTLAGLGSYGGVVYGGTYHGSTLYSVNRSTGALTAVGTGNISYADFGSTTSGLYAFGDNGDLYSINPTNGAATDIGPTGLSFGGMVMGMSSGSSTLYLTQNNSLYSLNTANGHATLIGTTNEGESGFGALVSVGGTLYGGAYGAATPDLYTVNPQSGATTFVAASPSTPSSSGVAGFYGLTPIPPTGAGPYLYVPNETDNTVSVIDTSSDSIVATIPVGGNDADAAAISPNGAFVYVASESGQVAVISTATNSLVTVIPVPGARFYTVAVSPDGSLVYAADGGGTGVTVIDAQTNSIITDITVAAHPYGIAFSPEGTLAYVTSESGTVGNTVSVINTATNSVLTTIAVGAAATMLAVSPDGQHVYVDNNGSGTVSVIDTSSNLVTTTINVGGGPYGIVFSPDGSRAYVANDHGFVSVIDTATNSVVDTIDLGVGNVGIAISPDGTHLFVTHYTYSPTVTVIDTATDSVVGTINVGNVPEYPAIIGAPVDQDKVAEVPSLTTSGNITVSAGGSKPLGITVLPNDSDDTLSVKISNVPSFETITAPSGDVVTRNGNTYTITAPTGQAINNLMVHSSYKGKGHPQNTFNITATNLTVGETATSTSSIKVTDPPPTAPGVTPPSLDHVVALFSQSIAAGFSDQHQNGLLNTNPLSQIVINQEQFLAKPHHG